MNFKIKYIVIFVIILFYIFIFAKRPPLINEAKIKSSSLINYITKFNYRQTVNDCGPFNTAAVVRALKNKEVKSKVFAETIGWRLPNKYTLPLGLEKQLRENGITIEKPNLKTLPDKEKIIFLQERLSQKKTIIILGERNQFEHYITIFGFNASKDEFYIYDSFHDKNFDSKDLTQDENEDLPGNKTLSSEDLLNFWRKGGMYGLYNWYALVASIS